MNQRILAPLLSLLLLAPAAAEAKRYNLTLTFGQDVLVVGDESVAVRARCVQNESGGGLDAVRLYATTSENAVLRGAFTSYTGDGDYLTSSTLPLSSQLTFHYGPTGVEGFYTWSDAGFVQNLTTQTGFALRAEATVLGLNTSGADCLVSVDVESIRKFRAAE